MTRLAVVTSSPPNTEGGHLVIARALTRAAEEAGYRATLIVTPDFGFGRTLATYRANWSASVGDVDQVISLRYPSYAVRHPVHVCWLNHTMREYYDRWPSFETTLSPLNRIKEGTRRRLIHAADGWLFKHNVTRLVAQSKTIQRRLARQLGVEPEVVYPPPPLRAYRCDGYGDFIFAVSRMVPLKRIDLLIRALAEPAARHVAAVIAGDGDGLAAIQALARGLGVDRRVTFLGHIDDEAMLDHFARCRAVCFTPLDEDFGFVTVEAFASRKAVVTCIDSGGPSELVHHEQSGLVVEPTPSAVALALARLTDDEHLAERMGTAAAAQVSAMSWDTVIRRLVTVPAARG